MHLRYHDHSAVPQWLCTLASALLAQCEGTLSEVEAFSLAVQAQAAMQEGVVHMTWLDIVGKAVNRGAMLGASVQQRVLALCPEYGNKVNSWQHMSSMVTRMDPSVLDIIIQTCDDNAISTAKIRRQWFREPWFLLPASMRTRSPAATRNNICAEAKEERGRCYAECRYAFGTGW